jgi:glycosyltransferase involved in cell wall biosynthesis
VLLSLAQSFQSDNRAELIVVSQGSGMDWLRREAEQQHVPNIRFFPFQPFEVMADVLGSGDVLVAILDPQAGTFCVPSKILTYFCAGRPVLAAMPPENLAARVVVQAEAGIAVPPLCGDEFITAAEQLHSSSALRERLGGNARRYAETAFNIDEICSRFESLLVK